VSSRLSFSCTAIEREYRRFLVLNMLYPFESIVPCREVDKFWHAHILDTAAYRVDCERVFGRSSTTSRTSGCAARTTLTR
jgi:hypothetical protein